MEADYSKTTIKKFFNAEKVGRFFERSAPGGCTVDVTLSLGELLKFLYEKGHAFAHDDPEVRSVPALSLVPATGAENEGHYVAQLESKTTFAQVIELSRRGLSYDKLQKLWEDIDRSLRLLHPRTKP